LKSNIHYSISLIELGESSQAKKAKMVSLSTSQSDQRMQVSQHDFYWGGKV
jgi:hypothetical protein